MFTLCCTHVAQIYIRYIVCCRVSHCVAGRCTVFAVCLQCVVRACAITHACVCHDSFMRVQWLTHLRAMTHSYCQKTQYEHALFSVSRVCRDSSMWVPWLTHVCAMSTWTNPFCLFRMLDMAHPLESYYTRDWVMSHIWSSMTQEVNVFRCLLEAMMYEYFLIYEHFWSMTHSRVWHWWSWRIIYACARWLIRK